jgi:pyridoxine/pyridoxamine 5'-phosphate oxidase
MSEPSRVIADLRKSYERGELDEPPAADPLQQFGQWLQRRSAPNCPSPTR